LNVDERERYLNEAMEEHGYYLKRLVFSYLKDYQKAEDIVQDVFVKFYNSIDQFEGRSSTKTYLYRIAINKCNNYIKSWQYRKIEFTEKIRSFKKNSSVEQEWIEREQKESIAGLINGLPVKYREVIWLYYFVELSVAEISEVLKCSVNTVKTRLVRGRKLAKLTFEESGVEYEY